jgi:hypothetical protein
MGKRASVMVLGLLIASCGGSGSETPPPVEPTAGALELRPAPTTTPRTVGPDEDPQGRKKDPIEAEEEERAKRNRSDPRSDPSSR